MNERIKELSLQAMSLVMNGKDPDGDVKRMYIPNCFADKFAELVRADEREACAEICDGISEWYETRTDLNQTQKQVGQLAAEVCGVRIRERGEK
jgi:hypothetical protein